MWFDTRAKFSRIAGHPPATPATTAARARAVRPLSQMSRVSQAHAFEISPCELSRGLYEERAAICEYDGAQDRAEAEAAAWKEAVRTPGITALDEWR